MKTMIDIIPFTCIFTFDHHKYLILGSKAYNNNSNAKLCTTLHATTHEQQKQKN